MARRLNCTAAVLMLVSLVACNQAAKAPSTISLQIFGDPAEAAAYRTLIGAFQAKNRDVRVDLVVVGSQGDHMTKLSTAFSAGKAPDLFLLNYRRFGQFAGTNVLEPLGPAIERRAALNLEGFYPQALDGFRFDGTLQCLPQNVSTPVVYVNTKLFSAAGLAVPKAGWTWNDLVDAARKTTKDTNGDHKVDVRGIGFEPSLNRFAPFIWQAGTEIVDSLEKPTVVKLLDAPALEALRFLTDLQHRYHVTPTKAEADSEDVESRFAAGRLAMLIDSRRATTSLRAVPGLEWDVAPLPVHPVLKKPAVMLHSDAYCMAKTSKSKASAYRFVEFALGPEGAAIIANTGRTVPSLKSVAESPAFLDPSQKPASAQVFLDQIPAIRRFPNIATWHEIESKADPVIEEWFYSTEAPEVLGLEIDVETFDLFRK